MLDGTFEDLLTLLDLDSEGAGKYVGWSPRDRDHRVYGGQLLAQALIAALRESEPTLLVRSVHAYFVHPGDPQQPILYQVDSQPTAHGELASVRAVQEDRTLCTLDALLSTDLVAAPRVYVAPNLSLEDAPTMAETVELVRRRGAAPYGDWFNRRRPFDRRYVEDVFKLEGVPPRHNVWFRAAGPAGDDSRLHQALALYYSDDTIMDSALLPYGGMAAWSQFNATSLDHAMWFHRQFRTDDWHLFAQESPVAGGGRGFTRGVMWNRAGTPVATVTQEILMRKRRD